MAVLSYCAKDNHVFLTIFIAYQCKVHRVVARKLHPSLPCAGKNYAWATKCPEVPYSETPVCSDEEVSRSKRLRVGALYVGCVLAIGLGLCDTPRVLHSVLDVNSSL